MVWKDNLIFSFPSQKKNISSSKLEKRVLSQELVWQRRFERHLGPVVQVAHTCGVAALQLELDETEPDFYQEKR